MSSLTDLDRPCFTGSERINNPEAPGGAEFKPELIHNRSVAGSTLPPVDLNKYGAIDIVTSKPQYGFSRYPVLLIRKGK